MEIPEIKQQLSILTVLSYYGIKLNKNNIANCPFHPDDKPSLQIYLKTNTWHCFGCGKGTDTIDLIKHMESCTMHEAIQKAETFINQNTNIKTMEEQYTPTVSTQKRILGLTTAFQNFVENLKTTIKAQEYLKSRNIDYTRIIAGYDNNNYHQIKKTGKELQQLYLDLGLIFPDKLGRVNNYHSFFSNCIVFPTFDEQGNIINMYGRKIDVKEREGGHYKLSGEHKGLYPKYPEPNTETLLITECIIDAATLLQHEFHLAGDHPQGGITEKYTILSLYGAKIWTEAHTKAIQNLYQLKEIIFSLDGDKEGKEGTAKHSETVKKINQSIKISYIEIPEGEDINSIAQGHSPEIFTELISNRKPINNTTNFFFSPEKKGIKENGTSEIKQAEQEKEEETPIKTIITNGQENHQSTGKLNTTNINNITYETETLKIKLQGGIEIYNLKRLRVTMQIQLKANVYNDYRDTLDLYSNSQRKRLIEEVSEKLEQSSAEISTVITEFTNQLEGYRNKAIERKRLEEESKINKSKETFTQQEIQRGREFLESKDLMKKTAEKIKNIGLIGQEKNGMLLYFIYLTRFFQEPLHAIVQGKSASGKTYLIHKTLELLPKKHYNQTTSLSDNTLYASGDRYKHSVFHIEDFQGAYNAQLATRELMSNGGIKRLTLIINPRTGEMEQKELIVEGPICITGTTTNDKIYEDNANRCFQIQIEEETEQTDKILAYQRKEAAGLIDKSIKEMTHIEFKTAQLQIERVEVVIPIAEELRIPEHIFKKNRTHKHYLTLIKSIAFWNQKQRVWKKDKHGNTYIEAILEDVYWANYLCKESLLRKSDELTPQLRSFFESLKNLLQSGNQNSFLAKPIREHYRMDPMKLNRYLHELSSRGYIKQISGNRKSGYEYEIKVWDDYKELQKGIEILDEIYNELKLK